MELYNGQNLTGWWMSEKFDGIQGVWDGETLRTRTGNEIEVPEWWTRHLPKTQLTGELWIGRGCFDLTRSIVMSKKADNSQYWDDIRFLVFDRVASAHLGPYAEYVKQTPINNKNQVLEFCKNVLANGGEGVVFMSPKGERFKLIPTNDDDGQLVGFKEGRGRNAGRIGAYILKLRSGQKLNLGNGLDDTLRERPPTIGSIIKFTYRGFTSTGLPRFASFAGVRAETTLNF